MRFGHVNLVARNWELLADFYCTHLGCTRLEPARDLQGPLVDAGVGVTNARIRGVHVRLPGYGDNGPTLEIYRYDPLIAVAANVRRSGFGHLAFQVDDIEATRQALVDGGGTCIGDIVTTSAGDRRVSWCYVADPEGNAIELQRWHVD